MDRSRKLLYTLNENQRIATEAGIVKATFYLSDTFTRFNTSSNFLGQLVPEGIAMELLTALSLSSKLCLYLTITTLKYFTNYLTKKLFILKGSVRMSYVGCYGNFPYSKPGSKEFDYIGEGISPYDCVLGCKALNAEYAWLSYYVAECLCSKTPPRVEDKKVETVCNDRCFDGDSVLTCGSDSGGAYSVYQSNRLS